MKDRLTGLSDRHQFLASLHGEVRNATEHKTQIALLVIAVHRFRRINKVYGFKGGDRVLQAVADVLREVCRGPDYIARIGDNEFAMILSGVVNEGHATLAAFKIQRLLDIPVQLGSEQVRCSVSIGIALCPENASEPNDLLIKAEAAQQLSKHTEQAFCIAEKPDDTLISEDWDVEVELVDAIETSAMRVYFQPKVSMHSGLPTGAEALIRWNSPSRGIVSPEVFMPVADEIGITKPLTGWMLNSAMRLSSEWTRQWGALEVSVNIPTRIMEQPDFVDLVLSSEGLWRQDDVTLCLEVLESSFIDDVEACFFKLKELQQKGIHIAIDDFGTGYSSLSYFRDIPANELKIDRSFVSGLLSDKVNANIVALIIDMAHRFNLTVVAEGAEDMETVAALKNLGCDKVQGFVYSTPLPSGEFADWLRNFKPVRKP